MSESIRIAGELLSEPPLLCAAILVAMYDDPKLEILPEDRPAMAQLRAKGCIEHGRITPLGSEVALALRRKGIRPVHGRG